MAEVILELKSVSKTYSVGGVLGLNKKVIKAVDNASFFIPGGEPTVTCLVGESGSGKSTIFKMILGLLDPTSGEISYKGKNISFWYKKDKTTYRREVQAIFQDPYSMYNPFYKVDRVFKMAINKFKLASSKEEGQKLILESLEAIGLRPKDVLGRYPHQ